MAAGTVDRQRPDPAPRSPIVVEDYTAELNGLVAAHNDLYNDWKDKVSLISGTQITAGSETMAAMQAANVLGLNAAWVTGNGLVIEPTHTVNVATLTAGVVYNLGDALLGENCVYRMYRFTYDAVIADSSRKYVHFPTPITLPSDSFGVPIGTGILVYADDALRDRADLTFTWTAKEYPASTLGGTLRINSLSSRNYLRLFAVPGGYLTI